MSVFLSVKKAVPVPSTSLLEASLESRVEFEAPLLSPIVSTKLPTLKHEV